MDRTRILATGENEVQLDIMWHETKEFAIVEHLPYYLDALQPLFALLNRKQTRVGGGLYSPLQQNFFDIQKFIREVIIYQQEVYQNLHDDGFEIRFDVPASLIHTGLVIESVLMDADISGYLTVTICYDSSETEVDMVFISDIEPSKYREKEIHFGWLPFVPQGKGNNAGVALRFETNKEVVVFPVM